MARLVVLRGGHSMERDVSFVTGRRIQHALERLGHEVHPLDIEESTTQALMELAPEAAFICLHGPGGDGTGAVGNSRDTVHGERTALEHPLHGQGLRQAGA